MSEFGDLVDDIVAALVADATLLAAGYTVEAFFTPLVDVKPADCPLAMVFNPEETSAGVDEGQRQVTATATAVLVRQVDAKGSSTERDAIRVEIDAARDAVQSDPAIALVWETIVATDRATDETGCSKLRGSGLRVPEGRVMPSAIQGIVAALATAIEGLPSAPTRQLNDYGDIGEPIASGDTVYQLRISEPQAEQIISDAKRAQSGIEVTIKHRLADWRDVRTYSLGVMLEDQEELMRQGFWRGIAGVHSIGQLPAMVSDPERVGHVVRYTMNVALKVAK